MITRVITNKEEWDGFILKQEGSFLQSFDWGEFKKDESERDVVRVVVLKEGKVLLQAQAIREKASFLGSYYHIPYGPVYSSDIEESEKKNAEKELIYELKKRKPIFILVEPFSNQFLGKDTSIRIEPQKTTVIDLEKDNILESFKKDTRYSIRVAEKSNLVVRRESYDSDFFNLLQQTKERQGFSTYNKDYFLSLISKVSSSFFSVRRNGELVAGAIVVFFGKTATYLHAASNYKYRKFCAPSLLQAHIATDSKKNGFTKYDLWGIDEKKYPGVTHFKKGFSGKEILYPNTKRIVIFPIIYVIYIIGKKINKML